MNTLIQIIKTAILIAVLICCTTANAQEYNNWLLPSSSILNFGTSPASIICHKYEKIAVRPTAMLSNDDGEILLYAYKNEVPQNSNNSISDFVIKDRNNQTIVSTSCVDLRNVICCRLPHGGYCIAAVIRPFAIGELHVYMFDKDGILKNKYIYDNGNYSFFVDFIPIDDNIALIAYKSKKIETYKISADKCFLWEASDIELDQFTALTVPTFNIEHTLDGTHIIVSSNFDAYILNFDKENGYISIDDVTKNNQSCAAFTFSKTDKYFIIIDSCKIKCFRFDEKFKLNFDNPAMIYNLICDTTVICNQCWVIATGVDGKIYTHFLATDSIIVLDGIEDGNITEETIKIECVIGLYLPTVPRGFVNNHCRASAYFDNAVACHGQPLNIISTGDAPFEIQYTIDGEEHNITTSEAEYQLPSVPGKYKITKIKDATCEALPARNNTSEIAPAMKPLKIISE